MTSLAIGAGTEITLHFSLRLNCGEVVEDTRQYEAPGKFIFGDGQMLPGFERKLVGLCPGVRRSFIIPAKDAFGLAKPDNIQRHPKSMLGKINEHEDDFIPGLVIGFKDTQGQEVSGVIKEIDAAQVVIDFNHPLAGKDVVFDIEIIDVQAAPTPVSIQPAPAKKD